MTPLDLAALLFGLSALFGLANYHLLRLPTPIGLVIIAFLVSLSALGLDRVMPGLDLALRLRGVLAAVDFRTALMDGMLCFLLFAGALHLNLSELREERWPILILATVGVALSTLVVGYGFHLLSGLPLTQALVFGALISPTDPVAVVGIVTRAGIPHSVETRMVGESLFNDGVGIVAFVTTLALAGEAGMGTGPDGSDIMILLLREIGGGLSLGAAAGWLVYRLLRRIDEAALEIMLTLALVTGTYALAEHVGISGPLAVVAAGLVIGNQGIALGMSARTRQHMQIFWNVIDEILNAVLFLLIGFEVLALPAPGRLLIALGAVPLVLAARLASITAPALAGAAWRGFDRRAIAALTWGGLRGGISVALALSLPDGTARNEMLVATYAVVVFSIIVQGLTLGRLVRWLFTGRSAAAGA